MGWPEDGQLTIKSLARPSGEKGNQIQRVELLGSKGKLKFTQTTNGLVVTLPTHRPSEFTVSLKIIGTDLKPVPIVEEVEPIRPDAKGNLTLSADAAELHGDQIKQENQGGQPNIGFWERAEDWVSWKVQFTKAGTFEVSASCATLHADAEFTVEVAGQQVTGKVVPTDDWANFHLLDLGKIEIKQPGEQIVKVRPNNAQTWKPINLRCHTG